MGEGLPAVGDDVVLAVAEAAAEIENGLLFADGFFELVEFLWVELTVGEKPGGEDDFAGTGVEPLGSVLGGDTATDLQTTGPSTEGFACGVVVTRTEFNDVAAREVVLGIGAGEPCGGVSGGEIGLGFVAIAQSTADNLFDGAVVQINARSKFHPARVA